MLEDNLLILGRIITIFPLLLAAAIFMGKRSISELPIFDFLIILSLGSVTGADIADPSISHTHTAFAIIAIALLQKLVVNGMLRMSWLKKRITFSPTVVIENGVLLENSLKSIHYSAENILQLLRAQGIFDIRDVQTGVLEGTGSLSVKPYDNARPLRFQDKADAPAVTVTTYPIFVDGRWAETTLQSLGLSKQHVENTLGRSVDQSFIVFAGEDGSLFMSPKDAQPVQPFHH
ncbi:uncharacterized membrane protein YcaP (DUF421 family) [Salsuginibacillus halophilus]|uniref:Uncharacterized membrane protein YcaP (DUF421 family) n=1 Tax=Salsuginibacillus halophilus TaxID=517424 RepID=A0A2P8HVZ5_9BACI|nr:YetF domain-containing protein [Salsuginibacillus halophilus]PSL50407.1 uncharacterized membrane protein YcaP (DUF421 family) [Salsuginibacillus halophilus]